jgi:hypothetical protein
MDRARVVSTNLKSVGFEDGVLEIEFMNGNVYQFTGPGIEQLYTDMLKAPSIGTFFETRIRSNVKLRHQKVPRANLPKQG